MLLERAEALVQLNDGRINEAINIVNEIRNRAKQSTGAISNYQSDYGVRMNIMPYSGTYNQTEALNIIKMERRLEMGMESERFFDLVRWGEADIVLNKYFAEEASHCYIYTHAHFTPNKTEYLPIPYAQIAASNGHYKQNIGQW